MDPDEPVAPWFDDVFERLADGRSAALRRRLAAARLHVAGLVAAEHPGADLTPDLFLDTAPTLVVEVNLPGSAAAARSYVSALGHLVDAAADQGDQVAADRARREIRSARQVVDQRAATAPDDPWASRIPRRLLQGPRHP
jgi:hypothetical protein